MYKLKKNGKVFTSKSVGTGPSSYEKRTYRAAVSQSLRYTALRNYKDKKLSWQEVWFQPICQVMRLICVTNCVWVTTNCCLPRDMPTAERRLALRFPRYKTRDMGDETVVRRFPLLVTLSRFEQWSAFLNLAKAKFLHNKETVPYDQFLSKRDGDMQKRE